MIYIIILLIKQLLNLNRLEKIYIVLNTTVVLNIHYTYYILALYRWNNLLIHNHDTRIP